jgi:hypothetical protein
MSDTRDVRALLAEHGPTEDVYLYCMCGVNCGGEAGYALHLADLINAEFLVVPRSDIVGTEYGWRHPNEPFAEPCYHDALTEPDARRLAGRKGEALQRPILPWSPIPLPEGES